MLITKLQFLQRITLVVAVIVMVACSWLAPLDTAAKKQIDIGLNRALISFAAARALNAVISVAQGTEIAVEPAGVGVIFTPGQLLDPVNDLVEKFSDLMLVASVAFGVQKVLMNIGAYWMVSLALSITALTWTLIYLRQKPSPAWLSKTLVGLLMIRFAVPVITIGTEMLFQKFMATDYQSSQKVIDTASVNLGQLSPPEEVVNENRGVIEKLKGWWSQNGNVKLRFERMKQAAEQATVNIIRLMAIFVLQTMVIPILLLWALCSVARRSFKLPIKSTV